MTDKDSDDEPHIQCDTCILANDIDIKHSVMHLSLSLDHADLFEVALNVLIRHKAEDMNISKSAAMNIILEEIRDEMRKISSEDFSFDRTEFEYGTEERD